ncbi:MAG: alpha-L-fucosidase [Terriglobales bacterium]
MMLRRLCALLASLLFCVSTFAQKPPDPTTRDGKAVAEALNGWWTESMKTRDQRLDAWWRDAKFGCFIHWGVYSGPGGEWKGQPVHGYAEHLMRIEKIPLAEYKTEVVEKFDPEKFNADEWVKTIKGAGMKWIVITSKHHDGFAMWPSKVTKYNIHDATKFQRDPMKELADAARRNGLHFGFYYSHAYDWQDPNAPGNDWDYDNPGGSRGLHGGAHWYDEHPELLEKARKYVDEKAIPQIRELIAMYHPDIMWFDTESKLPLSEQLRILKAAREAAPDMIINGRCARGEGYQFGDYDDTSDRAAEFPAHKGPWETIPTINESYGYSKFDNSQKPPEYFIRLLAKAAARGGNILMNIGPMGDGEIDPRDKPILAGIGRWMSVNGASIYGSEATPLPVQAWGESTRKGNDLYLQVFDWPADGKLIVGGLKSTPVKAYLLADATQKALKITRVNDTDVVVDVSGRTADPADTVVALEFAAPIETDSARLLADHGQANVLRSFDAERVGEGLKYGDGKAPHAYVMNWTRPDQQLRWNVRLDQPATLDVAVRYTTGSPNDGGNYVVEAGGQKLNATVEPAAKESEAKTAQIGRMSLPAGQTELVIRPTQVKGEELMRIFEITLTPVAGAEQQPSAELPPLPGKGMAQHPFLYCGEWQRRSTDEQTMYIVRDGKVTWSYTNPHKGEIDDCTMLSNGNIVFARQAGASEVTQDKKIVWNYDAPAGTEIHTAYPIDKTRVLIMQNGDPAKLMIINTRNNKIEKELTLPTKSTSTHGQFRHIRMTPNGHFLVAHLDLGKVVEYDQNGKEVWSVPAPSAWGAVRLKNGNTLISGNQHGYVREVNPKGEVVWEINKDDLPGITLHTVQEVSRLANGDTLINNWVGNVPLAQWPTVVQLIEVTPDKKVVWALRDWTVLGPASSTQLLDQPGKPEKRGLQR